MTEQTSSTIAGEVFTVTSLWYRGYKQDILYYRGIGGTVISYVVHNMDNYFVFKIFLTKFENNLKNFIIFCKSFRKLRTNF